MRRRSRKIIIYLICYIIEEIRKYIFDKFNINIPNKISIKINKIINFKFKINSMYILKNIDKQEEKNG